MRLACSILAAAALTTLTACGSKGISVPEDSSVHRGAVLFSERCSGCHTIDAAGTQGSSDRELRNQGPNFNQRKIKYRDAIYAIENGGFSGAIMPQNIVVGADAKEVARFLEKESGKDAEGSTRPGGD